MNTKTNNHQNEPTTTTLEQRWRLERRFITAVQGKGRLGKSLLLAALIEYLRYVGVLFKALDSDALNLSLANRYPTEFVRGFDVTQDGQYGRLTRMHSRRRATSTPMLTPAGIRGQGRDPLDARVGSAPGTGRRGRSTRSNDAGPRRTAR